MTKRSSRWLWFFRLHALIVLACSLFVTLDLYGMFDALVYRYTHPVAALSVVLFPVFVVIDVYLLVNFSRRLERARMVIADIAVTAFHTVLLYYGFR